jgi:ferredoxin
LFGRKVLILNNKQVNIQFMLRKIIQIDEEKCNGCGLCIPNCPEGALQIIDGKARLVSDLFCDGLGACMGHCPEGAIEIVEREAEPYDETKVMDIIVPQGRNTILAHLDHLRSHHETDYLNEAIAYIKSRNIDMSPRASENNPPVQQTPASFSGLSEARHRLKPTASSGCPGCQTIDFRSTEGKENSTEPETAVPVKMIAKSSELKQWPVQMHLVNPMASYFQGSDLLLAADCVAFAMGDFHERLLKDKSLAIACPKLDSNMESYIEKLNALITRAGVRSITVAMMEVPCCGGLLRMVLKAMENSERIIPVRKIVVNLQGEILQETVI